MHTFSASSASHRVGYGEVMQAQNSWQQRQQPTPKSHHHHATSKSTRRYLRSKCQQHRQGARRYRRAGHVSTSHQGLLRRRSLGRRQLQTNLARAQQRSSAMEPSVMCGDKGWLSELFKTPNYLKHRDEGTRKLRSGVSAAVSDSSALFFEWYMNSYI